MPNPDTLSLVERLAFIRASHGGTLRYGEIDTIEQAAQALLSAEKREAELRGALQTIIDQWDSPNWKLTEPTAEIIGRARRSLSGEGT